MLLRLIALCAMSLMPARVTGQEVQREAYFVTISVNSVAQTGVFPAFEENGEFMIEAHLFQTFGFKTPSVLTVQYRGRQYLPVSSLVGLTFQFDRSRQHLSIACSATCFPANTLHISRLQRKPDPAPLGFFINYDLLMEKSGSSEFAGGLAELGVFSDYGSGMLTVSGRDFTGETEVVRLDSNWTIDKPDSRTRLRFGDSITRQGGWSRAVRFGGIQFGTDFGLQPGFISFPTPTITGGAALPSTAEIFVNGVRRANVDIEPGAFTIEQPPVITGSGNLLVVVRDLLGRETIISHPFYASRNLLREGLFEYSLEAGFLRDNYGIRSNDYDDVFLSATYREGLNRHFTAGVHAEASGNYVGFGPYVDWQTPFGGILSSAAAFSVRDGKEGALLQLNFDWVSQSVGFSVSNEWISSNYSRLGVGAGEQEPRMQTSANLGLDTSESSTLSVNYLRVDERDDPDFEIASVNFSLQINKLGSLSVNVSRSFGAKDDTSVYVVFTARLGKRSSGSATLDYSGKKWSGGVRASSSAPTDGGFGFQGEASYDRGEREAAGVVYNSQNGIFSLEHNQIRGNGTTRIGARGGIVVMEGSAFLTNPVNDSFALVQVGDYAGVSVLRDNRPAAKTNSEGQALIAGLRPYEENRLSIDPLDLPLTADIGALNMSPVPRRRSGVMVRFPVQRLLAATARVIDSSGTELPAGTLLHAEDGSMSFPVGFGGAVYFSGVGASMVLRARLSTGACLVTIPKIQPGPFPDQLGTLECRKVTQ